MKQNGRKSGAALASLPKPLERQERLQPPDVLDIEQTKVWVGIVNGHPADWFDAGAVPLMVQLCRHVCVADRIASMIDSVGNNAVLLNLLNHQRLETEVIRKACTALRLTPQSLINHNANKKPSGTVVHAPWTRTANAG